jgi:hypothetical protein
VAGNILKSTYHVRLKIAELSWHGVVLEAVGKPADRCEHAQPAKSATSGSDLLILGQDFPLREENRPVALPGANERQLGRATAVSDSKFPSGQKVGENLALWKRGQGFVGSAEERGRFVQHDRDGDIA